MVSLSNMEAIQKKRVASGTKTWSSTTPRLLVVSSYASKKLLYTIGWLRDDYPENHREQGGLLIGYEIMDAEGNPIRAEVTDILVAKADIRSPGYIEWSGMEDIRLQRQFFEKQEELSKTNPELADALKIIGWWHTHPNYLPVFMSETDMETQRLKFSKPNQYSLVLNPHRGIFRAFAGCNAEEVPVIMLLEHEPAENSTTHSLVAPPLKEPRKGKSKKEKQRQHTRRKKRKNKKRK